MSARWSGTGKPYDGKWKRSGDVIVTDIAMPGLEGTAATRALLARRPGSRVVLITVHNDPELVERGYAARALAYVTKLSASRDLVPRGPYGSARRP